MVSSLVRLIVRDEISQKDRFIRDNSDVMAQKVREMHAKLVKLKAMGERVLGLAGMKAEELAPGLRPCAGNRPRQRPGDALRTLFEH